MTASCPPTPFTEYLCLQGTGVVLTNEFEINLIVGFLLRRSDMTEKI